MPGSKHAWIWTKFCPDLDKWTFDICIDPGKSWCPDLGIFSTYAMLQVECENALIRTIGRWEILQNTSAENCRNLLGSGQKSPAKNCPNPWMLPRLPGSGQKFPAKTCPDPCRWHISSPNAQFLRPLQISVWGLRLTAQQNSFPLNFKKHQPYNEPC